MAVILEHQRGRGRAERLRRDKRALPREQIVERRIDCAGGMRHAHREKAGVLDLAVLASDSPRTRSGMIASICS